MAYKETAQVGEFMWWGGSKDAEKLPALIATAAEIRCKVFAFTSNVWQRNPRTRKTVWRMRQEDRWVEVKP
jgi:hypothetical protein